MKRFYRWMNLLGWVTVFLVVSAATLASLDETYYWFINFDPSTSYVGGLWIFFQNWIKSIFSIAGIITLVCGLVTAFYQLGKIVLIKVYHEVCYATYGEDNYDEKTGDPIPGRMVNHHGSASSSQHALITD